MSLLRSIATIGGLTLVSRVFGFIRDMIIAALLGAAPLADALVVAYRLPNLFRRLFAEGAFNMAFVPLYAEILEHHGEAAAKRFAEDSLATLLLTILLLVGLAEMFMPWVVLALASGFAQDSQQWQAAVTLSRITFPYILLISAVTLIAGVLNSHRRFAAAAAAPILLNLTLICAALAHWSSGGDSASASRALAWGMTLGGAVQVLWLVINSHQAGLGLGLRWPSLGSPVRDLLRRAAPAALGAGIYQINLVIDTQFTSFLPGGSVAYLFYADRVTQLPLGVIGVAAGTALLPVMSRHIASGREDLAHVNQNRAFEITLLITLPAATALWVIAQPVIDVLFRRGAFDESAVLATAAALSVYALGLPAYVLVKSLTPGFFARGDTRTPVKVAVITLVINAGLNALLMGPLLHVGIALATVISSWINCAILAWILARRGQLPIDRRLRRRVPAMAAAALTMALVLWGCQGLLAAWLDHASASLRIAALAILVVLGVVIYGLLAQLLGAAKFSELKELGQRRQAP